MSRHRRPPQDRALNRVQENQGARWSKLRLLGLFFLFDALLIVAVLLSFQGTELVQEEVTLIQTREVFETRILEYVITDTTTITQVMPYGWEN
jgi:hypothetical protein